VKCFKYPPLPHADQTTGPGYRHASATLRESSIIVGAAIGAVFFKERFGAPRIAAAGLLVMGIGLMPHAR
jgi:drug/metabolite transporter (DMT)-like permease